MSGAERDSTERVGTTVAGKYRIDQLIGRGGMGAVFQATNIHIQKRVALKFLDPNAATDLDSAERFQREALAASAVESAHIVHIFDTGVSEDGLPFLVLELLRGEDLRARLRRDGRIALAEAVHIAGQVLRGLSRAHDAGIVHRDLKPDNVFLCQRDDDPMFVKIVDFGISKISKQVTANTLTRRGTVLGTAYYMSPEQAQAFKDIDGRADLYSLGAILFEALAGRPPHVGTAYEAVLIDICTKDADDIRKHAPDVPEPVAQVVTKALKRDRAERYQTAGEMYEALAMAAPGLLRSGGPTGSRDALLSDPMGASRPASAAEPRTQRPGDAPATGESAAVRPVDPRRQTRRTVVAATVAALGAFALTVFLMANRDGGQGAPAPSQASAAPPPAPAARLPSPSATAEPTTGAQGLVEAGVDATAGDQPGEASAPALPKPKAAAPKPPPEPSGKNGGVAAGLQLKTSDP